MWAILGILTLWKHCGFDPAAARKNGVKPFLDVRNGLFGANLYSGGKKMYLSQPHFHAVAFYPELH
jgi:hypothetical protein